MSVLPADQARGSIGSARPCSHRHRALARRPAGGVRRHARHGDATVCSWTRSRRGDAFLGTEGAHRAVLFARRRVDRIPGRTTRSRKCRSREGRPPRSPACRKEVAGARAGETTAPSSSLARRASPECLRPGEQRPRSPRPMPPRASVICCHTRCPVEERSPVHDHELRRLGDGERRPAVARQRRAARPHPRRRRRPLCQHGAPRVHEDRHVDGRALRRSIAAGNRRTSGLDRGRDARRERTQTAPTKPERDSSRCPPPGPCSTPLGGIGPIRESSMVWVDRTGVAQPLAAAPAGQYLSPRLSPDGKKVAVHVRRGASRSHRRVGVRRRFAVHPRG